MYFPVVVRPRPLFFVLLGGLLVLFYLSLDTISDSSSLLYHPHHYFTPEPSNVLLVSAFFPLAKSKHTLEDYDQWLSRFLGRVDTHIYFFTTPEMAKTIRQIRGDLPMTLNTTFATPFAIPPLKGLEVEYTKMHELDPEKDIHGVQLYAVWSSKTYFLDEAMKNTIAYGHHYDHAFWNDAGSFRDDQEFTSWPDGTRIAEIWNQGSRLSGTPKEDLFFMPIWSDPADMLKNWHESDGAVETGNSFSEGSFFGGSAKAIHWWTQVFYAYHDYYLFHKHLFVGKDQLLFNSIFFLYPERFITVWQYDSHAPQYVNVEEGPLGACGGTWWYYQYFVAAGPERNRMERIWNPTNNERKTCKMTRVLTMTSILKAKYGNTWKHPMPTIDITVSQRTDKN